MALKLYLPMDEGTGIVAVDKSVYKNHGTLTGPTHLPTWTTGKMGGAIQLDGVDDLILIPYSASLGIGAADYTVGIWFKFTDAIVQRGLFDDRNLDIGTKWAFYFELQGTGSLIFDSYGFGYSGILATPVLTAGQWYHIMVVRDSTAGKIKMYLNGAYLSQINDAGDSSSTNDIRIGDGYSHLRWSGVVDDARIYDTALSAEEIHNLYLAGCLKLLLNFDESAGGGITALDRSGNGNNGTLTGPTHLPTWVAGKYGTAIQFDGIDDYVEAADSVTLHSLTIGSFSLWQYYTTSNIDGYLIDKGLNSGGTFASLLRFDDKIQFYIMTSLGNLKNTATCALPKNQWNHIVGTWSTITNNLKLYLNSILLETVSLDGETPRVDQTHPLRNGARSDASLGLYAGLIDDVRIYDVALSAAEILAVYNEMNHPLMVV